MSLPDPAREAGLAAMLEAASVAVVGASSRPGTFGQRMLAEVCASPARPRIYPVNPHYRQLSGRTCYRSLADLPEPVDLVLLGVPDPALEGQLTLAAARGDRAAVIYGNAHEDLGPPSPAVPPPLRARLAAIASAAGMELCGAGCMGFVNVAHGLRAVGYTEPDPLPAGPVALVTHSGSVFSALLRTRRAIGFTLAVSSGQELVTAAPSYLDYALTLPGTRVLALVLEAIRQPDRLRQVLARAAERDIPVVLLSVGNSAAGAKMVTAHSGALAAGDGGWEALSRAYGLHRVGDLSELADTLELFAIGARPPSRPQPSPQSRPQAPAASRAGSGIATVHDSGLERAHAADLADQLGVPFAQISEATRARLAQLLDPGLEPANPLDVWGTGSDTRRLFASSLSAFADDPSVSAVALAVDLVSELDGDDSYPQAVLDAAQLTSKPVAVLSNLPSAIDQGHAAMLRQAGIPVLEGLRSGLLALGHWLDHTGARKRYGRLSVAPVEAARTPDAATPGSPTPDSAARTPDSPTPGSAAPGAAPGPAAPGPAAPDSAASRPVIWSVPPLARDRARHRRGTALLAAGTASGAPLLELLREYGIAVAHAVPASCGGGVLTAAQAIGFPVVLKTDEPAIQHKSDSGGVVLDLRTPLELAMAYQDLSARLGPRVLVCETIPAGVELSLGIARDPALGPLIVVGAGGVLVEVLADRAVALPPVGEDLARQLITGLRIAPVLAGFRGGPQADLDAIVRAVADLSILAAELGDELAALDINPLICGPSGAVAVDALAIRRS